jgi:heme o synthase
MSATMQPIAAQEAASQAVLPRTSLLSNYAELMKPRVTSLVVATAWCGYFMGAMKSGVSSLSWTLLHTLLGIGIVAGGAAALNQVMERDADSKMRRTERRPLPAGRMGTLHAALFGLSLLAGGSIYLALTTNLLTGYLAFATAAGYLLFYTPLKQITSLCTFVGAFPGAMPPLLGWTAARGMLEWEGLALFAIVLLWQFPHFLAIAWMYAEDYAAGGIRMLPVVEKDGRSTTREILLYSTALIPVSVAPVVLGMTGGIYFVGAILFSLAFFWAGLRLWRLRLAPSAPQSKKPARQLLQASVIYLPLLFALMMITALFHSA